MSKSLLSPDTPIKVSSTLDKSVGKKHLVDSNPETCWTSQQGLPQYVQLGFPEPVIPETVHLTFQGGFVGTRCAVKIPVSSEGSETGNNWHTLIYIFPGDINNRQEFSLQTESNVAVISGGIDKLRLEFEESSDFFGRITLYDLKLYGETV
ncbi:Nuclear receptor 2C2-associated protein [Mycena venus]|uniref:Nuclear receptor 2C2-associated protein n=1 Tax=Mycena venus TaxID=2733690 RepID=A0A8H6XU14_9AGAR|nr:Nuclear receptor 2C2-associated protein [Mycena venus]